MPETPDQFPEQDEQLDAETLAIRTLNDQLRTTFSGGQVLLTPGVNALKSDTMQRVIDAVAMFRDIWDSRIATLHQHHAAQKTELKRVEADIRKAADLLIATDSAATMRAIETKIEKLEAQKALIAEDLQNSKPKTTDFDGSLRTAMNFLSNPWKLWETGKAESRQTVLKLVFDAPIPYARDRGFRTAKTTLPFKVLADLNDEEGEMAETKGCYAFLNFSIFIK